jgi:hypothetical protein
MEAKAMQQAESGFRNFSWARAVQFAAVAIILFGCTPARSTAQEKGQKTFASAEGASQALINALKANDENAILDVLGKDAKEIISSGDEVEDKERRESFVKRYDEMHRLFKEPDGTTTLYIGMQNWPAPIPLVNKGSMWYFDTDHAKMEILYRRIGLNEVSSIHVCQRMVLAQNEYYNAHKEYAQKIFSDPGQQNGLYWKAADGEPQSPIGPLVANAVAQGYAPDHTGPATPYRGYFFHMLTAQGKNAQGGAKNYLVDGKMTNGFAFIAYPAEYRSSGVMTFIVGPDGVVYEKDLGKKTEADALTMKSYNPDSTWQKAQVETDAIMTPPKQK